VVITLLFGGAWFNRTLGRDNVVSNLVSYSPLGHPRKRSDDYGRRNSDSELSDRDASVDWVSNSGTLSPLEQSRWRNRKIRLFRYQRTVSTPNTTVFKDRLLSRLLQKFPFLVEAWYWALIYWVSGFSSPAIVDSCTPPPSGLCGAPQWAHAYSPLSLDPNISLLQGLCLTLFFLLFL
jgi:hypothetical protein